MCLTVLKYGRQILVGGTVGDAEIQFAVFFVVFGGMGEEGGV